MIIVNMLLYCLIELDWVVLLHLWGSIFADLEFTAIQNSGLKEAGQSLV